MTIPDPKHAPDGKSMVADARALLRARAATGRSDDPYVVGAELLKSGDSIAAAASFVRACELMPSAPWPFVGLGDARREQRDRLGAVAAYSEALRRTPVGAISLRLTLAASFAQVHALDEAESLYRTMVTANSRDANDERATTSTQTASAIGIPADARREATIGLARVLAHRGHRYAEEAAGLLDTLELIAADAPVVELVLSVAPRHPGLFRRYGQAFARQGANSQAIEMLRRAIDQDADDHEAALLLGDLVLEEPSDSLRVDLVDELLPLLERALVAGRVTPGSNEVDHLLRLARLSDAHRPSIAGLDAWQRVVDAEPGLGLWQKELGDRLAELGRFEEAGLAYDQAVGLGYEPA